MINELIRSRGLNLKVDSVDEMIFPCNTPRMSEVIGAQRPRAVNMNGTIRMYTARKHKLAMACIADMYIQGHPNAPHATDLRPIIIEISTQRKLPQSAPKKRDGEQDVFKPDIDNICKLVLDALTGLAWQDDAQIIGIIQTKQPRTGTQDHIAVKISYCTPERKR